MYGITDFFKCLSAKKQEKTVFLAYNQIMKIAVISDPHASYNAVKAVLDDIEQYSGHIDEIWCLGDLVGYSDKPELVIPLIREKCQLVIAGNHDYAATGKFDEFLDFLPQWLKKSLTSVQGKITIDDFNWLYDLPAQDQRYGINIYHGSASDPITGLIYDKHEFKEALGQQQLAVVGHSHVPSALTIKKNRLLEILPDDQQIINLNKPYVLNPGSCGLKQSKLAKGLKDHRQGWLLLDLENRKGQWFRVDTDLKLVNFPPSNESS
jgi:predicted phosphodiesterase